MCGEQETVKTADTAKKGSPPRVRGTDALSQAESYLRGITPACAGNRLHNRTYQLRARDHPRVCGEQGAPRPGRLLYLGSPPRVRGTGARRALLWYDSGITPACAGNSCPPASPGPSAPGSPPRVRGTGVATHMARLIDRITPACAGNRISIIIFHLLTQDHPRVCGEQCRIREIGGAI